MLMPLPGGHAKRYTVELAPAVHTDECSVLSSEAIGARHIRDRIRRACNRHSCGSSQHSIRTTVCKTPSGTNFTRPDELPVPVPVKRPVPDARFFQVPVVVRCGAGALVGWNGLRFVCVIHVPVCPLLRVGSRLPRCLTGTGTPGLGLSHVRTRGFLLGPINDVQQ